MIRLKTVVRVHTHTHTLIFSQMKKRGVRE